MSFRAQPNVYAVFAYAEPWQSVVTVFLARQGSASLARAIHLQGKHFARRQQRSYPYVISSAAEKSRAIHLRGNIY